MRVIGGDFKGRRLQTLEGKAVRPTSDMVKEALFNILQTEIADSVVLDLFAGSGGIGIEAISRGAERAVFCDKNHDAIKVIYANLSFVPPDRYEVFAGDYTTAINRFSRKKFDIVFIDPPYNTDLDVLALNAVCNADILADDGIICVEHSSQKELQNLSKKLIIISTRRYGNTALTFFRRDEAQPQ